MTPTGRLASLSVRLLLLLLPTVAVGSGTAVGPASAPVADPPRQPTQSPDPLAPWLDKLRNAGQHDYAGELVYHRDGQITSLQIVHHGGPDGPTDRLLALDGARREILRNVDRVSCRLAPGRTLELPLGSDQPRSTADRLTAIRNHYRASLHPTERIANRETQPIRLTPKGDQRYEHRLWLDTLTGLPLKTQVVSGQGEVIEELLFTKIAFADTGQTDAGQPQVAAAATAAPDSPRHTPSAAAAIPAAAGAQQGASEWVVDPLPTGFWLADRRRVDGNHGPADHLVFSDGIATVSVFVEVRQDGGAFNGLSRRGSITLYGRSLPDHQVTVIGEVPAATARRFGESLHGRRPDSPTTAANQQDD